MFCSCCLTTLEVTHSKLYDANLCPKCEANIDDATDAAHEHDLESGDHADLEDEEDEDDLVMLTDDDEPLNLGSLDDSFILDDDEDWDEYGDYIDDMDDAEHASLYAEDHYYE